MCIGVIVTGAKCNWKAYKGSKLSLTYLSHESKLSFGKCHNVDKPCDILASERNQKQRTEYCVVLYTCYLEVETSLRQKEQWWLLWEGE